jgi:hypothetical protein
MDITRTVVAPKKDFIKHVFNFSDEHKSDLFNTIQYLFIAFFPVLIINHLINKLYFEYGTQNNENELKKTSSFKLLVEVLSRLSLTVVLLYIINQIITYFPTYSGKEYTELNMIAPVLFMISATLDESKYKKIQVLLNRFDTVVFDDTADYSHHHTGKKQHVTISQPFSTSLPPRTMPTHQESRADYVDTNQNQNQMPPQQSLLSTSNQLYGGPTTKLVNADFGNNPNGNSTKENFDVMSDSTLLSSLNPNMGNLMNNSSEPAAANDVLGGSFGSSF